MSGFGADLRHSARGLRRTPGSTALAVLTVALGIGANTTIFSILNGAFLHPPALDHVRDPGRLVVLWSANASRGLDKEAVSPADFRDWEREARSCERLGALTRLDRDLTGSGEPVRLEGAAVSAGLFPLFGLQPRLGRGFLPEDERPGAPRVTILSDGLWRRRFAADPSLLGKAIILAASRPP